MPNNYFHFRQFTIHQDRCAMKVGTDGVLLGAWANAKHAKRILDIGTGTGLIALMLAQRSNAIIDAIEIDYDAALQASENVRLSPWNKRIRVIHTSFQEYCNTQAKYDLIVTNPPYFIHALRAPDKKRSLARHNHTLEHKSLIEGVHALLDSEGFFTIILPAAGFDVFSTLMSQYQLYISRRTNVLSKQGSSYNRILAEFSGNPVHKNETDLIIESGGRHQYSLQYIELTKDYYLNF